MTQIPHNSYIILFDGLCNLCNSWVQFVIKRDRKKHFLFTHLQSKTAKIILKPHSLDLLKIDTVILLTPKRKIYIKSTAALHIARLLPFPIKMVSVLLIIPVYIRSWIYDFIARNRYKWYGKKDSCMAPTLALKSRFLD